MLKTLLRWRLRSAERQLGGSLDYMRHVLDVSQSAFFKLAKLPSLSQYRKRLPAAPFHIGRLVATLIEDCGDCVKIVIHAAKKDGIPKETIQAVLDGRPDDLPESLADVYRFAHEVATASGSESEYRDRIRKVFGEEGLIELSMAIATCRVYPTLKRGLGYAQSCSLAKIEA